MYKGMSVNECDEMRMFNARMDDKSKGFNHNQLDSYIDTCMDAFTEEQQLYMANRILNNVAEKKWATEHQNDNQESSL